MHASCNHDDAKAKALPAEYETTHPGIEADDDHDATALILLVEHQNGLFQM